MNHAKVMFIEKTEEGEKRQIAVKGDLILRSVSIEGETYYKAEEFPEVIELNEKFNEMRKIADKYYIFSHWKSGTVDIDDTLNVYSFSDGKFLKLEGSRYPQYCWYEEKGYVIAKSENNEYTKKEERFTYVFKDEEEHKISICGNVHIYFYYDVPFVLRLEKKQITHVYDLRNKELYEVRENVLFKDNVTIVPKKDAGFHFLNPEAGIMYDENGAEI